MHQREGMCVAHGASGEAAKRKIGDLGALTEAPDSGHFRLLGRLQAVWRMKLPATLTRRVPAEFRGERDSNEASITVKSIVWLSLVSDFTLAIITSMPRWTRGAACRFYRMTAKSFTKLCRLKMLSR